MNLKKNVLKKMRNKIKRQSSYKERFRQEALSKRTPAELWAENNLLSIFNKSEFDVERNFDKFRFDFYFPKKRIALEIDGEYHLRPEQIVLDKARDEKVFKIASVKTIRVFNFDKVSLENAINEISLSKIITDIQNPPKNRKKRIKWNTSKAKRQLKASAISRGF